MALIKLCLDCNAEVELIGYAQTSAVQAIYAYFCQSCNSAFKLVETKRPKKSSTAEHLAGTSPIVPHDTRATKKT